VRHDGSPERRHPPDARADGAPPLHRGRRRPAVRRIAHAVLFVALVAGGYRIVNYRLPLIPGAIAYIRLRLRPDADGRP
jgi:hypothetical protein